MKYLTIKELSLYIKISISAIYKMIAENRIPFIRINKRVIRFDIEQIDSFMKGHENKAA